MKGRAAADTWSGGRPSLKEQRELFREIGCFGYWFVLFQLQATGLQEIGDIMDVAAPLNLLGLLVICSDFSRPSGKLKELVIREFIYSPGPENDGL